MKFDDSDGKTLLTALESQNRDYIVCHGRQTIYGTGTAQKVYLRVQEFFEINPSPKDWSPKKLAAHVATKHIVKENYPAISNYWLSVKSQYIKNDALPDKTPDDLAKKQFWGQFQGVYDQQAKDPRTKPVVPKGPEIRAPGAGVFLPRDDETLIDDIIVRRSCKFLLYDAIERKQDIAYVLDDLDLNTVAQRLKVEETTDRLGVGTTERKVPVCTSELREIFRRWDYFVDHLTFYKDWKVSDPPWYSHGRQHWAAYAAHLAAKIGAKDPGNQGLAGQIANINQLIVANNHLSAILAFHGLRPSRSLPGTFVNLVSAH